MGADNMGMKTIQSCRICGNRQLDDVLDLGHISMTGIFPSENRSDVASGALTLQKCKADSGSEACGLLQLKEIYDTDSKYGQNYGYRSGITQTMQKHLGGIVRRLTKVVGLGSHDTVLDIGSNDGTLLKTYQHGGALFGVDPSAEQFHSEYPDNSTLIVDFFPSEDLNVQAPDCGFKVITSIAMFYDLHDPLAFMRAISEKLAPGGVWYTEQSYVGALYEHLCYDSVCHEHFNFYGLSQLQWMAERANLKIIDVVFNDINGGSFGVLFCNAQDERKPNHDLIQSILQREKTNPEFSEAAISILQTRVDRHITVIKDFFEGARQSGEVVLGYGASTKGNVLLQCAGVTAEMMSAIAERDPRKFGCYTPGTKIPIVSEIDAKAMKPDYLFVLPWHFKSEILQREREFLEQGGKIIFPLPRFEIHSHRDFAELKF